jgi:cytochrome c oxidase subunit 2
MDDEQNNENHTLLAWILGIAVTIAIAVSLITGIMVAMGSSSSVTAGRATGAASGGAAATTEVEVAPDLATGPGYPALVRLHFDTARFDLPADAAARIAPIADWAKAGAAGKIGISGFHDRHGDAAANAVLARNRAAATRDALLAAGVAAERIVMVKPQETTGGGDDREARRVDIYPAR